MDDDALLARLAALRGPVEDADAQRIVRGYPAGDGHDNKHDDISALLASLGAGSDIDTADLDADIAPAEDLETKAAELLKQAREVTDPTDRAGDQSTEDRAGEPPDDETEEEILERALAEAALDDAREVSAEREPAEPEPEPAEPDHAELAIQLPSTLALPLPSLDNVSVEAEDDDEDQAKIDALMRLQGPSLFPSVPSSAPLKKGELGPPPKVPGQGFNLPGFNDARDEDLDSWCSACEPHASPVALTPGICNKDAEVKCVGCEGDLYCRECWGEGHGTGPGQERGHKAVKFVWRG